jgi:hypothetical protein
MILERRKQVRTVVLNYLRISSYHIIIMYSYYINTPLLLFIALLQYYNTYFIISKTARRRVDKYLSLICFNNKARSRISPVCALIVIKARFIVHCQRSC